MLRPYALTFNDACTCTEVKHLWRIKCQPSAHVRATRAYTMQHTSSDFNSCCRTGLSSPDDNFRKMMHTLGKIWRHLGAEVGERVRAETEG